MNNKENLQKKYDDLLAEIKDNGFKIDNNHKIYFFENKMVLELNANFYSHYDGYNNEAVYENESCSIELPSDIIKELEELNLNESITFDIEPDFEYPDSEEVTLNVFYNGKLLGHLYLEYESVFVGSWRDYTKFVFRKKNDKFVLENINLKFRNDQEEHVSASFEINYFEQPIY